VTPEQAKELRAPFPANAIGQLPKPIKKDAERGRCDVCGGWHGLPAVHLDYVGHAAVTDRLLAVDPSWTWEPFALTDAGLPAGDGNGNLWIRLTVCGVTRPGVGDGASMKERIGDAIRNAAMRFGVALDLWAKEDLHDSRQGTEKATGSDDTQLNTPDDARAAGAGEPRGAQPPTPPSRSQTGKAFALFGEVGLGGDDNRDDRLAFTSGILGHEVGSWTDVTADEAGRVIDALEARKANWLSKHGGGP
jgi:hypothetical protein